MTDLYKYDEAAALESSVTEIHNGWKELRDHSSTGKKAWLTQMKKHYGKIIQADPEAAAELLATHEYFSDIIKKYAVAAIEVASESTSLASACSSPGGQHNS